MTVHTLRPSLPTRPAGSQLDVAGELLAMLSEVQTEPRRNTQLEALTLAVAADLPVLLWGEPGIGKTAALTQLAESLDLPLTTVIASVHEPSDFSGLPIIGVPGGTGFGTTNSGNLEMSNANLAQQFTDMIRAG